VHTDFEDIDDFESGPETVNGIPIADLQGFMARYQLPVSLMLDYALSDRGLDGLADPRGIIWLSDEIKDISNWQLLAPDIKITQKSVAYLVLLHELAHFKLGDVSILTESERQKPRRQRDVYQVISELPEDLHAMGNRIIGIHEDRATTWAINAYKQLLADGVL
jgi:hypothetical protein